MPASVDTFGHFKPELAAPYDHGVAVTTSDTVDLVDVSCALWVGGAGNVKVDTLGGETVIFTAVPAGTELKIRAKRVYATLTTATNIVAMW